MAGIERVTQQLLDLLDVLLTAHAQGEELHGYAIKKRAGLSGPSTYRGLDRLEDGHLVDSRLEELPEGDERPRRRYYRLNADGVATARRLLGERRPEALRRLDGEPAGRPMPRPGIGMAFSGLARLVGGLQ